MINRRKNLSLQWTSHLKTAKEKEDFEATLRHSLSVLTRLKTILGEKRELLEGQEGSDEQYSSPSWTFLQAHRNGRKQELKELTELLSFIG